MTVTPTPTRAPRSTEVLLALGLELGLVVVLVLLLVGLALGSFVDASLGDVIIALGLGGLLVLPSLRIFVTCILYLKWKEKRLATVGFVTVLLVGAAGLFASLLSK